MRLSVFSESNFCEFVFDDNEETQLISCPTCSDEICKQSCHLGYVSHAKILDSHKYVVCHPPSTPKKQVRYFSKLAIQAFKFGQAASISLNSRFNTHEIIALHNIKRLVEGIGLKLEKTAKLGVDSEKGNKLNEIAERISIDPRESARNILSAMKSAYQVEYEFDAIDKAKNLAQPNSSTYTKQKIHTLLIMGFYLFEEELRNKSISVDIMEYHGKFNADFGSARSAVSQIFSNAVKFCKENSRIDIRFIEHENYVSIVFKMISRYFSNEEISQFILFQIRGKNSVGTSGDGIGLYSASLMMKYNSGLLQIESNENTRFHQNGQEYSENKFILQFLKA